MTHGPKEKKLLVSVALWVLIVFGGCLIAYPFAIHFYAVWSQNRLMTDVDPVDMKSGGEEVPVEEPLEPEFPKDEGVIVFEGCLAARVGKHGHCRTPDDVRRMVPRYQSAGTR